MVTELEGSTAKDIFPFKYAYEFEDETDYHVYNFKTNISDDFEFMYLVDSKEGSELGSSLGVLILSDKVSYDDIMKGLDALIDLILSNPKSKVIYEILLEVHTNLSHMKPNTGN